MRAPSSTAWNFRTASRNPGRPGTKQRRTSCPPGRKRRYSNVPPSLVLNSGVAGENVGAPRVDAVPHVDASHAVATENIDLPCLSIPRRKCAFADIADSVQDDWPEETSAENDPLVIDAMISFIDDASSKRQPFFGYVQLDSSHAPYTFPPEFGSFEPYTRDAKLVRYIDVLQRAPEMRNRYFNAVLWESHEVGRLWKELERRGLLDSTVVLITGDHGEEFNEHGFWTHSGGFTPEQIHVPAILWWPGATPEEVRSRTTHADLAATFLEALGVKNPPSDYSQGRSLLDPAAASCDVSCGWRDCAAIDDSGYVVFGIESHDSMSIDVLDSDYREVSDPRASMAGRTECMLSIMQGMGAFLR